VLMPHQNARSGRSWPRHCRPPPHRAPHRFRRIDEYSAPLPPKITSAPLPALISSVAPSSGALVLISRKRLTPPGHVKLRPAVVAHHNVRSVPGRDVIDAMPPRDHVIAIAGVIVSFPPIRNRSFRYASAPRRESGQNHIATITSIALSPPAEIQSLPLPPKTKSRPTQR